MWKDRRSHKSKCAVQQAEQTQGSRGLGGPGTAGAAQAALGEAARVRAEQSALHPPPPAQKSQGEPGTLSSGEMEV